MFGLDEWIASLAGGGALAIVAVAVALGLRHATDPDHLMAVSMLIAADEEHGVRRAALVGAVWGLGHAVPLLALGAVVVFLREEIPEPVSRAAEAVIGLVIVALAARLLVRWRRGEFHAHAHAHGGVVHRHLHSHAAAHHHDHEHRVGVARSPLQAFGIGLVHGVGGSAGVSVLLLAQIDDRATAVVALGAFALFTVVSMTVLSTCFGHALTRPPVRRRLPALVPAMGVTALLFGVWYALGAVETVPYVF